MAVLADGRVECDEPSCFTGRVAANCDLDRLAPGSCLLVATKGLYTVPWGRPFPQHHLVVGSRCT